MTCTAPLASLSAQPPNVAYLGPAGSFTGQAALQAFGPAAQLKSVPAYDIPRQVRKGTKREGTDFGVIAVVNIKHGYIENTFSALYETADVQVVGEILLPVEFHLLAGPTRLQDLHTVRSHEAALSQCRVSLDRLAAELGRPINRVPTTSTSAAVQQAAEAPGVAALGSMEAARQYAVQVLRTGMQDHPQNVTQFWVIGLGQSVQPGPINKTLFLVELEPGTQSMFRLVQLFWEQGVVVNMFKEHIIPQKSRANAWSRAYFIECDGHISDPGVNVVHRALRRAEWEVLRGRSGRLLGSYPAYPSHQLTFQPRQQALAVSS
jgi:prephenate dehydratase